MSDVTHAPPSDSPSDDTYPALLAAIAAHFERVTRGDSVTLFETDAPELAPLFLDALPVSQRQLHTCGTCAKFMTRFGALVVVGDDGKLTPALWPTDRSVPEPYVAAMRALGAAVARANVIGVFLATERAWGRPKTGAWQHFAVTAPDACLWKPALLKTASQLAAEKRQDYAMLVRGLDEFPRALVNNAYSLLTSGGLYRSEKCIGVAKWLKELHETRRTANSARQRDHLTWRAVATAPPGFCHVRSTMIGTLLDDLAAELPFPQVKARFDAKMHPLQYLRPTAAPTAGNIAQAEKVMATMQAAGSLERRFARLDDLRPLWTPRAREERREARACSRI